MQKLAIIMILMGILVPSMLGYVKKSKEVRSRYENDYSYDNDYEWDD